MTGAEDFALYRPCVGIMLLNSEGRVFIGKRRAKRGSDVNGAAHLWQMPQGGIDPGEDPYQAALRELAEETGIRSVEKLAEAPDWYCYDLPPSTTRRAWRGRYKGQRQRWFALRHIGPEDEINVAAPPGGFKPEFETWRWAPMSELTTLIIPFKRPVYEQVVAVFSNLVPA